MKAIKFIGKLLLWIVGIVVVLLLALPLWIGPVVKTAANAIVPKKTGTTFNLGAFGLNPYSGKLAVGDVQLWNPQDFDQKMAATLGSLDVVVDVPSLAGDVIVVKDIVVKDVFVSYVSNGKGENNFAIIKKNAAGKDEAKAKGDGEVKVKGEGEQGKDSSQTPQTSQTSQAKPSKKVIIDHLLISNVMVQFGPLSLPLPNIELNGIGREKKGATVKEAWDQVYAQILQKFKALGVNLNNLVSGIGNVSVEKAMKAIDAVKKLNVKGATDAFKGGAGKVSEATGKTVDAVSESAGKAVDAVGESTGKAVDAIKGLFGK